MLDDETKASIEAVIVECEERLKALDADWEELEVAEVTKQLEAARAMLEDQPSDAEWESVDDGLVRDPESGREAERLPPALIDPATGGRYTENAFGYAEPDITRPDGADGPALTPAEVKPEGLSTSQAEPGEKKSSGRGSKNSKKAATKPDTSPEINENAADMRAELDSPEKVFRYFYDKCFVNPIVGEDGSPILTPPNAGRDLKAVRDFCVGSGVHPVEFELWFRELWAKQVGGRYSLGMELRWEILWELYQSGKTYVAPEENEWDEIEKIVYQTHGLFTSPIRGQSPDEEEAEWDRVLLAKRQCEDEIRILELQLARMKRVPQKMMQFLDTMFIESPAAEDFIARHAKKGTKYVDLPHGRLQQRKQAEALECFDENMFFSFVGKQGEKWANQYGMERRVSWASNDARKSVKERIEQYIKDGEDVSETGYRKRPEYQNISTNYGKEDV